MTEQPNIVSTPVSDSAQDSASSDSPAAASSPAQKLEDTPLAAPEPKKPDDAAAKEKAAAAEQATARMTERFTDLTAKNAQLTRAQRVLTQEKATFEQKQKANQGKTEGYDEIRRMAKEDPVGLLKHLDLDYADVTTAVLQAPPERDKEFISLQNEVQEMRDKAAEDEKQHQAQVSADRVAAYRDNLKKTIDSSADYALLQTRGQEGVELVVQVARDYLKNHKVLPTDEEALKAVENYLEKQVETALATGKLKAKFQPAPEKEPEKPKEPTLEPGTENGAASPVIGSGVVVSRTTDRQGKTLTNKLQSIGSDQKEVLLSNDESIRKAASGLKWDL